MELKRLAKTGRYLSENSGDASATNTTTLPLLSWRTIFFFNPWFPGWSSMDFIFPVRPGESLNHLSILLSISDQVSSFMTNKTASVTSCLIFPSFMSINRSDLDKKWWTWRKSNPRHCYYFHPASYMFMCFLIFNGFRIAVTHHQPANHLSPFEISDLVRGNFQS